MVPAEIQPVRSPLSEKPPVMKCRFVPVLWLTAALWLLSAFIHQQVLFYRNSKAGKSKPSPDSIPCGKVIPDDTLLTLDFENPVPGYESHQTKTVARSGHSALIIGPALPYSPGLHSPILQVDSAFPYRIKISAWLRYDYPMNENFVYIVTTGNHRGRAFRYRLTPMSRQPYRPGKWHLMTVSWLVPEPLDTSDLLQVYLWNPGNRNCYVDDLNITLFRQQP